MNIEEQFVRVTTLLNKAMSVKAFFESEIYMDVDLEPAVK